MTENARTLRIRRTAAVFLCLLTAAAALLAVSLGLKSRGRDVTILGGVGDPAETAARFFHALCLSEWAEASSYVRGGPDLKLDKLPEDPLERDIWEAYLHSWAWSMGEGGRTDSVTAWQTVQFTSMRPDVFTEGIDGDVKEILTGWVNERPLAEIYDQDGQFLENVVRDALEEAVKARLTRPEEYLASTPVTLQLAFENGEWYIVPEETLWNALSGIPEGGGV